MADSRAKTDATLNKLGDIYQYNIALIDCFELLEEETLLIETFGDISVISNKSKKVQREVKHHVGEEILSDRSIDFWKTVANWYEDYDRISEFEKLILNTTATISSQSSFFEWNKLSSKTKLERLKEIGSTKKDKEELFRKQYDRIFETSFDESRLLVILEKFIIESECESSDKLIKQFSKYISNIPNENRFNYISALLGRIMNKVLIPPHKWEVTKPEFDGILQELAHAYIKDGSAPLPKEFAKEIVTKETQNTLQEKEFIKAIKEIKYNKVIPDAMSDYWKTSLTISKYFKNNPIYFLSLEEYEQTLEKRLNYSKSTCEIKNKFKSSDEKIEEAKILYNDVMQWQAFDFGSIIRNSDFFQHGVIHNIVDANKFRWKLEETGEDEHK